MEFIKDWVLTIGIVAILLIVIEMMIPDGKYKAFIRMFSGMVVILVIISPVIQVLRGNYDFNDIVFRDSVYMQKIEIKNSSQWIEEGKNNMIVEEYRKKVIQHIEYVVGRFKEVEKVNADVIIIEDHKTEEFGSIRRIYVDAILVSESNDKKAKDDNKQDRSARGKAESSQSEQIKAVILEEIKSIVVQKVEVIPLDSTGNKSKKINSDIGQANGFNTGNIHSANNVEGGENSVISGNKNIIADPVLEKKIKQELGNIFHIDENDIVLCFTSRG